jgi:hypothetical protein
LLSRLKISSLNKHEQITQDQLKKKSNFIQKKLKKGLLKDNDLLRLKRIVEIQKNASLLFQNKTKEILQSIKQLKSEKEEMKKVIFPDLKPFLKTLNDMEIYTYNSLSSFKPSLDSLQKNKEVFRSEIKEEIEKIRETFHLKNHKIRKEGKITDEEDIFSEDEKFLDNHTEGKINHKRNTS